MKGLNSRGDQSQAKVLLKSSLLGFQLECLHQWGDGGPSQVGRGVSLTVNTRGIHCGWACAQCYGWSSGHPGCLERNRRNSKSKTDGRKQIAPLHGTHAGGLALAKGLQSGKTSRRHKDSLAQRTSRVYLSEAIGVLIPSGETEAESRRPGTRSQGIGWGVSGCAGSWR